jgi:outer membrane protein OmpA-like peptidoglycan-associated protein
MKSGSKIKRDGRLHGCQVVFAAALTGCLWPSGAECQQGKPGIQAIPAPYTKTRDQAGHEFVKTEQFVVPVGTAVIIEGLGFEPGSATLTPRQELIVQQVFNSLEEITENTVGDMDEARVREFKKMVFEIRAYSADTGDRERDARLSEERARVVLNLLTNLGTPARCLRARGVGSEDPGKGNTAAKGGRKSNSIVFVRMQ